MHGLPKDFDGRFFVGRTLEVVSFTVNSLFLSFGDDVSITVEAPLSWCASAQTPEVHQPVPGTSSGIEALLGKIVVEVHSSEDGTLAILFKDGAQLTCRDEYEQYESYSVKMGEQEVFV